ncbi:MAG: hypothetical protein ACFFAS_21290 [Promethearchaeota archaeon]
MTQNKEVCKGLKNCPFFNDRMKEMPATAELFKKTYCKDNFKDCTRFIILNRIGKEKVPIDLYPNQRERVNDILLKK